MDRRVLVIRSIVAIGASLVVLTTVLLLLRRTTEAAPVLTQKNIHYSFNLRNKSSELVQEADVVVFAPVSQSSWQRVVSLSASLPIQRVEKDGHNNQDLHFKVSLPPYANIVLSIDATLELRNPAEVEPQSLANGGFLNQEPKVESEDPRIKELAKVLSRRDISQNAKAVFDWITSNIKDSGYLRLNRGALFALTNRQGDCSEFAALFTAILRAGGTPARMLGGFVLGDRGNIRGAEYHNWAQFQDKGRWELADPYRKNLRANQSTYITFRIMVGRQENSFANSRRFSSSDERLEVSLQ